MSQILLKDIYNNEEAKKYINMSDEYLRVLGYTEHGLRHATLVSNRAGKVLSNLNYKGREVELAKIAGFMHDIGNVVNRNDHANSGALLCMRILEKMGMESEELATIVSAIGNHDEKTGNTISPVAAALALADKTDVHRGRVRNEDFATFDIHDRVNYAVTDAGLIVNNNLNTITLSLTIDTEMCTLIEYFEIFLGRMLMCRRAANYLNCNFKMIVNSMKIL